LFVFRYGVGFPEVSMLLGLKTDCSLALSAIVPLTNISTKLPLATDVTLLQAGLY